VLLEVGRIGRPHGLKGDVVVRLVTTVEERLAVGSVLECRGEPLTVERARPLPGRASATGAHWLVSFAGTTTREAAQCLTGATLRAEAVEGAEGMWAHELIGSEVLDGAGVARGRVVSVEANPASDLLVLDTGALVPLCFVVAAEPGRVTVEVPEGLFDL